MNKTVGLVSLGCSKNKVDAEVMLGKLASIGYKIEPDPEKARVIIVNTCGFITSAKEESIDAILEMAEYKKDKCKYLIVSGCLSERYIEELPKQLPEVDAFIGVGDYHKIDEIIATIENGKKIAIPSKPTILYNSYDRVITTNSNFAYVKIAEGCNNRCSYCAIPMIRGNYMSAEFDEIVDEAKRLSIAGAKEIVLIAQDTTRYGEDKGERTLAKLINAICDIETVDWVRVLYAYPEAVSDELLDTMISQPKVCKYLDIPIQHINDDILKAMNRRSDKKQITDLIKKVRGKCPEFVIRTSIIVGFPGETDEQFKELKSFIKEYKLDRVGVFEYSMEEGTKAATMKQVDDDVKFNRYNELMLIQQDISRHNHQHSIGKTYKVLIEGFDNERLCYYGRSQFDAPEIDGTVYFTGGKTTNIGDFTNILIKDADEYDLFGDEIYELA